MDKSEAVVTLQVFSLSEDLAGMGKMDPEPPQRTGIILAFNDMNEFEKYVSLCILSKGFIEA